MNPRKLGPKLREQALSHAGKVSLALLLEGLMPVDKLRELAQEHGVSPKGFRIERAPASVLAAALAQPEAVEVLDAVCVCLAEHATAGLASEVAAELGDAEGEGAVPDLRPLLKLREQELREAREELAKSHEVSQGQRNRADELSRLGQIEADQITQLQAEVDSLCRQLGDCRAGGTPAPRDEAIRIERLERELEEQSQMDFQQRVQQAEFMAKIRELVERVGELEALVPKGRRRKRLAEAPPVLHRFTLPHFTPGFLKSLANKDRRAVEAAYRSVFLYCTEGSAHPGLKVKSLEACDLFSLRASLKLRVFFRPRADGGIDIVELVDRQEQDTALRRHREKP